MNSQYSRRETIEVNSVPVEIQDASVCKALSLTGVNVKVRQSNNKI